MGKHTEILKRLTALFIPELVISHTEVISLSFLLLLLLLLSISPAASPLLSVTFNPLCISLTSSVLQLYMSLVSSSELVCFVFFFSFLVVVFFVFCFCFLQLSYSCPGSNFY